MFFRFLRIFIVVMVLVYLSSCSALQMRIRSLKKTGDVDLDQMRAAGLEFAELLADYLQERSCALPSYVALLAPKVDARKKLPIAAFEDDLVRFLLRREVYVVRRENRKKELEQIHFASNNVGSRIAQSRVGKIKVPDYFISVTISEKYYFKGNRKLQQRTYEFDFRSVVTQKRFFHKVVKAEKKVL